MKALSISQPWAELIIQGKKTLELRNWKVSYRGPLAIHASHRIDEAACRANGIDPQKVSTGVVLGTVDLVDIVALDEQAFQANRPEHLTSGTYLPPVFGWKVSNPKPLEKPVPYKGRMGLFNLPDDLFSSEIQAPPPAAPSEELPAVNSRLPFELQIKVEPGTNPALPSYRLAIYQRPVIPPAEQPGWVPIAPSQCCLVCELGGTALKVIADAVLEALRLNGYAATDLGIKRRHPFQLTEESGVRLALIFLAVRPITKVTRIEEISGGIRAMTAEELYYWFAHCTGNPTAERSQKALRLLLSEE